MSKQPKEYLNHILDEINYLISASDNLDQDEFMRSETLQRSFSRSIEIIGEATKKLSKEFTDEYPNIDWKSMAAMRDKLIHDYFGVDYEIV
ncbi:MAG: HepT-like ribonuclease domain-containing protein [Patescibacteria group bacterium]